MSRGAVSETGTRRLLELEHEAFHWVNGRVRVGEGPAEAPVAQELRVFRAKNRRGARFGVLRIRMEPVVVADLRQTGALGRVHKFRYRDASGGEWWWAWCAGCGCCMNRPDTGLPPVEFGCPSCGVAR